MPSQLWMAKKHPELACTKWRSFHLAAKRIQTTGCSSPVCPRKSPRFALHLPQLLTGHLLSPEQQELLLMSLADTASRFQKIQHSGQADTYKLLNSHRT